MTSAHVKLWALISECPGVQRAKPRIQILFRMRDTYAHKSLSDSEMRVLKEELIEQYGKPVGSSQAGWFKCEADADYTACIRQFQAKVNDMHKKIAALERIRDRELGAPELPLGGT